jgi:hypothetical protein
MSERVRRPCRLRLGMALAASLLLPTAASAGAIAKRTGRPAADLAVEINPTSFAGGLLDYFVSVENEGPGPASGVVLLVRLPAGRLLDVHALALEISRPACRRRARAVSCMLGGLAAHSYKEVVISMTAPRRGTYVIAAQVRSPTPDPEPGNNTGSARIQVP